MSPATGHLAIHPNFYERLGIELLEDMMPGRCSLLLLQELSRLICVLLIVRRARLVQPAAVSQMGSPLICSLRSTSSVPSCLQVLLKT